MDGFIAKPIDQHALFDVLEVVGRQAGPPAAAPAGTAPADQPILPLIVDPDTRRHVIGLFLETAPGQLDRLRRAVEASDAAAIATTTHALRGAMSHFATADLAHLEQLEELGREARLDSAPALLTRVEADVTHLLARLRALQ